MPLNRISGTALQINDAITDGDFLTVDGVQAIANKTISGLSNAITNIGNSSLVNPSITINGVRVNLGGSAQIEGESFSPFLLMGG